MTAKNLQNFTGLLPRISSMIFNRPMMIEDSKLSQIAQVLATYRGVDISAADIELLRTQHGVSSRSVDAEYEVVGGGLALIPVEGTLMHKTAGLDALSGLMSYKDIEGQVLAALGDNGVSQLALMIKSPGGDVQGVFDLAELIYQSRGVKPISAIVDETAASAAYLIASATSRIFVPQTAVVGSIGVVSRMENHSKRNEQMGIDVEYIYAGKKKVMGNPDTPITDEARAEVRGHVDVAYERFVGAVSRYTELSAEAIKATEAGVYVGQAAVNVGLASDMMSANEAIETLINNNTGNKTMSGNVNATFTQEQVDAKVTEAKVSAHAEGLAEGTAQGVKAEQERVSGILALDGADKHIALVNNAIANPKFNSEDVKSLMAAIPEPAVLLETSVISQLDTAMSSVENPDVGVDSGDPADELEAIAMRVVNS